MGERIGGRNFISRNGYNQATRYPDDVLANRLREIYDRGEQISDAYLGTHYPYLRGALRNRGKRRIFELAGINPPKPGQKMLGPFKDKEISENGV